MAHYELFCFLFEVKPRILSIDSNSENCPIEKVNVCNEVHELAD